MAMAVALRNLIVATLLVLTFVPVAAAQTGAVLTGVVHDEHGNPVPGAVLTLVDSTQNGTRVVVTDSRGAYLVDRLTYGRAYDLGVSHPQFRTSRLSASANEGDVAVNVAMHPRRGPLARLAFLSLRMVTFGTVR